MRHVCLFSKQKMEFKGKSTTIVIFIMVISVCIPLAMLNMVCYACSFKYRFTGRKGVLFQLFWNCVVQSFFYWNIFTRSPGHMLLPVLFVWQKLEKKITSYIQLFLPGPLWNEEFSFFLFFLTNQPKLTAVGFLFCMLTTFCSCWEVLHVQFYYLCRSWVNNSCASVTHLKLSKAASEHITSVGRERSCAVGVLSRVPVLSLRGRWDTGSLNNNSGLKQAFHNEVIWLISYWE